MREMKKYSILAVLVLVSSTLFPYLAIRNTASSSYPMVTLSIDPLHVYKQVGENVTINITVTNVTNLQSFSIVLTYDSWLLEFKDIRNGSMLNAPENAYFKRVQPGQVVFNLNARPETEPRNGNGTLATIIFQAIQIGYGHFILEKGPDRSTMLWNSDQEAIDFTEQNGDLTVSHIIPPLLIYKDYTLLEDIDFSDLPPAVIVLADDIVLDLNGHTINNRKGGVGIDVTKRKHVTIKNGVITNFQNGIIIKGCDQVNISNIKILDSRDRAMWIEESSNVRIYNNNILNSINYAMLIDQSSNVRICNNNVSKSERECLSLYTCSLSEVSSNILSNNEFYAIDMQNSTNNTISYNTISDNTPGGISIQDSSNNTILNNNFFNNTNYDVIPHKRNHVSIPTTAKASINVWNSSYPHGGNFWDDWNDTARQIVDQKSGKNQTLAGPDGIGDTPYVVNKNNQDEYPLMNPYGSVGPPTLLVLDTCKIVSRWGENTTTTCSVAVFSDSIVADFDLQVCPPTAGLISFNVSGGTFCKVIISRELLGGVFEVEVDEIPVGSLLNCEGDYAFANFTYGSGSHKVEIRGEMVVAGDINHDLKINVLDLFVVAQHFGEEFQGLEIGKKP